MARTIFSGKSTLVHADCFDWLEQQEQYSIHAVVTDPPYGFHEYTPNSKVSCALEEVVFGEFRRLSMATHVPLYSIHRLDARETRAAWIILLWLSSG